MLVVRIDLWITPSQIGQCHEQLLEKHCSAEINHSVWLEIFMANHSALFQHSIATLLYNLLLTSGPAQSRLSLKTALQASTKLTIPWVCFIDFPQFTINYVILR